MIDIRDLSFGYPNNLVLEDVSLTIGKNDFVVLKGDNGTGKTTLLNLISGTRRPLSGSIFFKDVDVTGYHDYQRPFIGRIFQESQQHIIPELTVGEFLCLAQAKDYSIFRSLVKMERVAYVWEVLNRYGLVWHIQELRNELGERLERRKEITGSAVSFDSFVFKLPFWDKNLNEFSGGEQQIISMLFLFLRQPPPFLILADEPTANLDAENRLTCINLLKALSEHCAVLIVSHDPDLHGNRSLKMKNRKVWDVAND